MKITINKLEIDMEINMKASWEETTLADFTKINKIRVDNIPVEDQALAIVSVLCGQPVEWLENQRITFVSKLTHMIDFLAEDIVPAELKDIYEINRHKYRLDCDISNITTAKYMDYQNFVRSKGEDRLMKIISVFLVPEGHEYNDGYDMEAVFNDMGFIKMTDYQAIVNFLTRQSAAFVLVSADCLKPTRKELKTMSQEEKLAREEIVTHLTNMASSLWSLGCAK